jgi:hypothetical protein
MRYALVPLIAVFAGGGCIEYTPTQEAGLEVFDQNPPEAIDILLVVDNSGSMQPYQTQLGANFEAFISWFTEGNVDYQIAVTTTDDGNNPQVPNAARGRFVGPIITSDMDPVAADNLFGTEVNVGTSGTGVEVGLKTAYLALTDEDRNGDQISEFLRSDAELSIVFVSDEEDSSPWPVNDYINAFFELKGHRDRGVFNASALTVTDETECTESERAASSPGTRYVDVASQTHGLIGNLCDSDFSHIVSELSLATSRMTDTYILESEPDASTIQVIVQVDGVDTEIPCDSGAWTYTRVEVPNEDGDQPAVIFDTSHLPPLGSRLTIRYLYGDGRVDAFCQGGS